MADQAPPAIRVLGECFWNVGGYTETWNELVTDVVLCGEPTKKMPRMRLTCLHVKPR